MKITATTSKIILFFDFLVALTLTVLVVVGAFLDGVDMSQVTTIALAWDGQLAVVIGFYFWKAKNENRAKGVQKMVRDLAEKYGIDSVARIAEIIFKE